MAASKISLYILTDPREDPAETVWALEQAFKGAKGRIGVVMRHEDPGLIIDVAALAVEHGAPCFVSMRGDGQAKQDYVHMGAVRPDDVVPDGAFTASAGDLVDAMLGKKAKALFVGPIFDAPGKAPVRTGLLTDVRRALPGVALYALGGIKLDRVMACVRAGADGVAVTRAVMRAEDPAKAAEELVRAVDRAHRPPPPPVPRPKKA